MGNYINHVTLTTGHCRRSPRDEVSDDTLAILHPWLVSAIASGLPEPVPGAEQYKARVTKDKDKAGLLVTVFAPALPFIPPEARDGDLVPLVTIGVAQRSRESAALWRMMVDVFGAYPGLECPSVPWCGVTLLPALPLYMDAVTWLGDFERAIAWAWITRNPSLEAIDGGRLTAQDGRAKQ